MATKPVLIRYESGPLAGAEYEVASVKVAHSAHPEATIVQYMTGEEYKPRTDASAEQDAEVPADAAKEGA